MPGMGLPGSLSHGVPPPTDPIVSVAHNYPSSVVRFNIIMTMTIRYSPPNMSNHYGWFTDHRVLDSLFIADTMVPRQLNTGSTFSTLARIEPAMGQVT